MFVWPQLFQCFQTIRSQRIFVSCRFHTTSYILNQYSASSTRGDRTASCGYNIVNLNSIESICLRGTLYFKSQDNASSCWVLICTADTKGLKACCFICYIIDSLVFDRTSEHDVLYSILHSAMNCSAVDRLETRRFVKPSSPIKWYRVFTCPIFLWFMTI